MPIGVQLSLDVGLGKKKNQGPEEKKKEAGEPQLTEAVAATSTALLGKWLKKDTHTH